MTSSATITHSPLPTLKRYKSIFLRKDALSLLRELQYEIIKTLKLEKKTLDFGGGQKAGYRNLLQCENYESANIDPTMEPTWLTKPGEAIACPEEHYDNVISFNTLEHIFDARQSLQEMFGALKAGGHLYCAVPFLYPVHAHPDDFFRPTASWFEQALTELGYKNIKIQPLLWGPFSTGLVCSGIPGPFKTIRKHIALLTDLLYAKMRFSKDETTFSGTMGQTIENHPLGYFVYAQK